MIGPARAGIFLAAVMLVALPSALASASTEAQQPNFLLIYLDNVGYGDLGCYGNREVMTPHLDRLAEQGVLCTDFYTASPSCSPSRGAVLTGRHPERNGLTWQLSTQQNISGYGLPLTERIIPQYLTDRGYVSGAFGKWNIGFAPGARPTDRGFDEYLGHASGNIHYFKHLYAGQNDLRQGTEVIDRRGAYATDLFAEAAIDFINRHHERPWFVYLPFNAAHFVSATNVEPGETIEWHVPPRYLEMYGSRPDEPDQRKRFLAVLTALDDAIGRVLATVERTGARDRTVVLCISDNGAFMRPGRGLEVQSNAPLREGGVTTYEGGVRVPAIVRWPGVIAPGSRCSEMLWTLDVLPMILRGAQVPLPDDRTIDGIDMTAILAGREPAPPRAFHWLWKQGRDEHWRGMRKGKWKLLRPMDQSPWELYDLSEDVGESSDLAAQHLQIVQSMAEQFERWLDQVHNDPTRGQPPPR